MNNNDDNFFDLSQIYDLDGRNFTENDKLTDDLTEMMGYNFLNEEEIASNLKDTEINDYTDIIENKNLVESSMGNRLLNNTKKSSEVEDNLNILNEKIFNFENVNIKNLRDFLETQTGKLATITITMGNDRLIDKIGMILAIGEDFVLLRETATGSILICPLKNIEFIRLSEI